VNAAKSPLPRKVGFLRVYHIKQDGPVKQVRPVTIERPDLSKALCPYVETYIGPAYGIGRTYVILCRMGQRKIAFAQGEFYHLCNRGNSKQDIFLRGADYKRFIQLLYLSNGTKSFVFRELDVTNIFSENRGSELVSIGAYCLMPNHFHILVTPIVENGVQIFMQKLATGYSMYFNKKYERTGGLFEGRFKSKHADGDEYLKYLFSYIHLNPVKLIQSDWKEAGIRNISEAQQYLSSYTYSSYVDYLEVARKEVAILNREAFPDYFQTRKLLDEEMLDWLDYERP
jgi:putative transposase